MADVCVPASAFSWYWRPGIAQHLHCKAANSQIEKVVAACQRDRIWKSKESGVVGTEGENNSSSFPICVCQVASCMVSHLRIKVTRDNLRRKTVTCILRRQHDFWKVSGSLHTAQPAELSRRRSGTAEWQTACQTLAGPPGYYGI
eukprot:1157221-Pelagomonas_calceolata.AAC.13